MALKLVAGDAQIAETGTEVPTTPSVRIIDQNGNGVAGVTVNFTPAAGSGTVTTPSATTGADGVASVGWTLATTSGAQSLSVAAPGVKTPLTFTATALAGAPAGIMKISGDDQTAVAGSQLGAPLVVKVVDRFGNPVSGLIVFFHDIMRRKPLLAASDPSDANGVAMARVWRVDTIPGRQTITASWGEPRSPNGVAPTQPLNPVTAIFTATATPRQ